MFSKELYFEILIDASKIFDRDELTERWKIMRRDKLVIHPCLIYFNFTVLTSSTMIYTKRILVEKYELIYQN
jgi:hypothetical protein